MRPQTQGFSVPALLLGLGPPCLLGTCCCVFLGTYMMRLKPPAECRFLFVAFPCPLQCSGELLPYRRADENLLTQSPGRDPLTS